MKEKRYREIPGFDREKLLERFDYDEESLVQVLRSYALNTPPIVERIRIPQEASLPDYAIAVHGIKGSSRGICAFDIGEEAEELEHRAKSGDMEFVLANNQALVAHVEAFIQELNLLLDEMKENSDKERRAAPDSKALERLNLACEEFDMDEVDAAMEDLEAYAYESGDDLILWLRERVERMEFDEIQEYLSGR